MTLPLSALKNYKADLKVIYGKTSVGGVIWDNVILAQHRAREWQSHTLPSGDERGGSSSPTEASERDEARRVSHQATKDAQAFPRLLSDFHQELVIAFHSQEVTKPLTKAAQHLAVAVSRYTRTVNHDDLPKQDPPGCTSCARLNTWKHWKQDKVWQPLSDQDRYASKGLCSWCGKHSTASELVVIEAVAIRHAKGEHHAGRWLAKQGPAPPPATEKACSTRVWTGTDEVPCVLGAGHAGICEGA